VNPEYWFELSDVKTIFKYLPATTFFGMLLPSSVEIKLVVAQELSWQE
jgi:hypothetical protein